MFHKLPIEIYKYILSFIETKRLQIILNKYKKRQLKYLMNDELPLLSLSLKIEYDHLSKYNIYLNKKFKELK
jgi:hypothetical protein